MITFISFKNQQEPFPLGVDTNNRSVFSVNYDMEIQNTIEDERLWEFVLYDYILQESYDSDINPGNLLIGRDVDLSAIEGQDVFIQLVNTGGISNNLGHNTIIRRPSLQILGTSDDYERCQKVMMKLHRLLTGTRNKTIF